MLNLDRVLTTGQAARLVGVSPVTIRHWVRRGWLAPLQRGTKPLLFHTRDVQAAADRHQRQAHHDHLDTLWQATLEANPDEVQR